MSEDGLKVLYDPKDVTEVIKHMAEAIIEITPDSICLVMVLKGGAYTGMRLLEQLDDEVTYGFIGLSSYKDNTTSCGDVTVTSDLDFDDNFLRDKNVWIVDDVIENGHTLKVARNILDSHHPQSIHTVTLVAKEKPDRDYKPDVFGLYAKEDQFILGCGMGLGELYRNLPCLCEYIKG